MPDQLAAKIFRRLERAMAGSVLSVEKQRAVCSKDMNDVDLGHLHEQICAEAALLAASDSGPSPLLRALCDLHLEQLCPMAAEAHYHATSRRIHEENSRRLAEQCPVFAVKKVMYVFPVGAPGRDDLLRIADRTMNLLSEAKIKKVVLNCQGLVAEVAIRDEWVALLKQELQALKIPLQVIGLD